NADPLINATAVATASVFFISVI
ncbi:MAG: hypothetical protein RL367_1153, partial [Pseudomonadota bacterium]